MAHAHYRMKGRCQLCEQTMFIGVCPHGMAEYVGPDNMIAEQRVTQLRKVPPLLEMAMKRLARRLTKPQ